VLALRSAVGAEEQPPTLLRLPVSESARGPPAAGSDRSPAAARRQSRCVARQILTAAGPLGAVTTRPDAQLAGPPPPAAGNQATMTVSRMERTSVPEVYRRGSRFVAVYRSHGRQRKQTAATLVDARAIKLAHDDAARALRPRSDAGCLRVALT
jgi:hypothetical protein